MNDYTKLSGGNSPDSDPVLDKIMPNNRKYISSPEGFYEIFRDDTPVAILKQNRW